MELKDRYYTVLDSLPEHIFVFTESGTYVDVYGGENNATEGIDCKFFIGQTLYDVSPPELAKRFHSYILEALKTNEVQIVNYKFADENVMDLPEDSPDLSDMWFEGTIKPLPIMENGERTVLWIAKNITQRYLLEQRLKELSEIDDLTKIANRRSFTHALTEALKENNLFNRRFSLLMLDIDKFKRINDTLGHACGDEGIQHTVNVIKSGLRESDYIGRIGGEEFAIILYDTDLDKAVAVAEKLRCSLEEARFVVNDNEIQLTISVGVTHVREDDSDIKSILARADKAMYHSKRMGRNRVSRYSVDYEPKDR